MASGCCTEQHRYRIVSSSQKILLDSILLESDGIGKYGVLGQGRSSVLLLKIGEGLSSTSLIMETN